MNEKARDQQNAAEASSNSSPKKSVGDYIDFEEIK